MRNSINSQSMYWPPLWAKMLVAILLPLPRNKRQQSVNDIWSSILDHLRTMEWCSLTINLSAALMCKHASDDIAWVSYNWAPLQHQQSLLGLSTLHSNELHCIVPKFSLMWSVFSICPCIQLHKYACNVSQIWLFLLLTLELIFKNPHSALL